MYVEASLVGKDFPIHFSAKQRAAGLLSILTVGIVRAQCKKQFLDLRKSRMARAKTHIPVNGFID